MEFYLWLFLAGFIYIVTPGPVFVAIIHLVSNQGKRAGFRFIIGAILGCVFWFLLTLTSLIEAQRLPSQLFIILTFLCASYLFYLGLRMIKGSVKKQKIIIFEKPFREGFILSLLNPKSYPVMASVFSTVMARYDQLLIWDNFIIIFCISILGFFIGYCFMVTIASVSYIHQFYMKHLSKFSFSVGGVFIFFSLSLLYGLFL